MSESASVPAVHAPAVGVTLEFGTHPLRLSAAAEASPAGLLSIGALVSGILLSSAVIVWTATSVARRHGRRHAPRKNGQAA